MLLLLKKAVLCSDANVLYTENEYSISGDPTEVALVVAAAKAGISIDGYVRKYQEKMLCLSTLKSNTWQPLTTIYS
jgi:Ca2+-transporting ATPase